MDDRQAFETEYSRRYPNTAARVSQLFACDNKGRYEPDTEALWSFWQAAIAYERERAAKVCESLKSGKLNHEDDDVAAQDQAFRIAAAEIRKGSRFGGLSND